MEQRLASHNENKQTNLSELKSKNGLQSDQALQDEEDLKLAMDQIDVKAPPTAGIDWSIEASEDDNLTKSQQMVGQLALDTKGGHSHKPSINSNVESEASH